MTLAYGRELQNPATARQLEFLMTCSHAYGSSSVGGNTRKFHGLFVHRKRVLLAGLDESVNGTRISAQQYQGTSDEPGLRHLYAFSVYPPRWSYQVGDVLLEKTVTFTHGVTVTYRVAGAAELVIRPLITDRPFDEVVKNPRPPVAVVKDGFRWGAVQLEGNAPFTEDPQAYHNLWYSREQERGYDPVEDLWSPGYFSVAISDDAFTLHCYPPNLPPFNPPESMPDPLLDILDYAANAFCHRDEIHAGYPWFAESWGRDSAVSVTGLLIGRGQKEAAREVLLHLANHRNKGIIPNRFPDNYHTSDASLWFIHALGRYRLRWGDDDFIARMHPVIADIIGNYPASEIARLDRGLVSVAPRSTWMDTRFTPRGGKPVEVNALWVHALYEAESLGIVPPVAADEAAKAFSAFWNPKDRCLFDRIDPVDPSIRPNQVVALALGLLPADRASAALATVTRELLTPYGLRTLSPRDPQYRGRFTGDESYHNGCVWPWLTGMYVDALLRSGRSRPSIAPFLAPVLAHIREAGAGYISEILDGDPPHAPHGCIAQAWSVAEVARACRMVFE